ALICSAAASSPLSVRFISAAASSALPTTSTFSIRFFGGTGGAVGAAGAAGAAGVLLLPLLVAISFPLSGKCRVASVPGVSAGTDWRLPCVVVRCARYWSRRAAAVVCCLENVEQTPGALEANGGTCA